MEKMRAKDADRFMHKQLHLPLEGGHCEKRTRFSRQYFELEKLIFYASADWAPPTIQSIFLE